MTLDEVRQTRQQNLSQPGQKFGFGSALELSEVAMCLEHRLLDDVRWADAWPQAALQLRAGQQGQIVAIQREQFADRLLIALTGTREQPARAGAISAAPIAVAHVTVARGGRVYGCREREPPGSTAGALRWRHEKDMKNEEKSAVQSPALLFQTEKGQAYHANSGCKLPKFPQWLTP